jgi:hypothetical protein
VPVLQLDGDVQADSRYLGAKLKKVWTGVDIKSFQLQYSCQVNFSCEDVHQGEGMVN